MSYFPLQKKASGTVSFLSICAVSKQPPTYGEVALYSSHFPEATPGVITMETVDHLTLVWFCLLIYILF